MKIAFRTKKLEKTFNSERELGKAYGAVNGRIIMKRMTFLAAAPTLAQVPHEPPFRCHELSGNRAGEFAVDLQHPFRLVLIPDHDPVPRKADGGIDLSAVTAVTIISVEDYH